MHKLVLVDAAITGTLVLPVTGAEQADPIVLVRTSTPTVRLRRLRLVAGNGFTIRFVETAFAGLPLTATRPKRTVLERRVGRSVSPLVQAKVGEQEVLQ